MSATYGISVVIPNYNGAQLLRDNLPSVLKAAESWGGEYEIIVVDDCSRDESCQVLRDEFPTVRLLVNPHNLGFSKTCNAGMSAARFPILLCINTDVKVEDNLLAVLAPCFADRDLFAVTPRVIVEREGIDQGAVFARISRGFIKGSFARSSEEVGARENLYAVGACVAYDAQKFQDLGGYSEIFSPYLFEDVDLSYRAWKRGWKSIYRPQATVWHYSSATLAKAKRRYNKKIYFRNRFLFHWINLSDPGPVLHNALITVVKLAFGWLWFNFIYYQAFLAAFSRRREVSALRREERKHRVLTDAEIVRRTRRGSSPDA